MTKLNEFDPSAKHKAFAVFLNETLVGTLTWSEGDYHQFELDKNYDWSAGDPVLSLSLKNPDGAMNRNVVETRRQLPPFFSNLLPEGALRNYLAALAGVKPMREFFLLDALKNDLPGAVFLQPCEPGSALSRTYLDAADAEERENSEALRFSLAGIQLKFSAIAESGGGLTIPAHGVGGSAIVKLPSTRFKNVPENEFSMMKMAAELGMNVSSVKLRDTKSIQNLPENLPEAFGQSLIVSRFDRRDGVRIHMEDFAQVFKIYPEGKYDKVSYGGIAKAINDESGALQLVEFVRRLAFTLLIGNADMHLKNWSFLYLDPQKPTLSPAYDFVPTIAYLPDEKLALSIAGEKTMAKIDEDQFSKMASKAGLPVSLVMRTVRETAKDFRANWSRFKRELPMSEEAIQAIEAHQKRLQF